ncbi:MAG: hypothetical protein EKK46_13740 [Rhodocyclaceae bacterium]|nr:MAG: hypothetical protein EKK46_13740 [Rhodocyclaceae bacterium]
MNREHLLFHLGEALEELSRTKDQCQKDIDYSEGELFLAMQHLYHHLNTAWNGRSLSPDRVAQSIDQDFNTLGAFPSDIPPLSA